MEEKEYYKKKIREFLEYEIHGSWLCPLVSYTWLQELLGSYFAWKVKRKFDRMENSLKWKQRLKS